MSSVPSAPAPLPAAPAAGEPWLGAWAASADPVYCRDLRGEILEANPSFIHKFGRAAGQQLEGLLHADDEPVVRAAEVELARAPHRLTSEHRWVTPQGVRWFSWEETGLLDAKGGLVAVRAVGRDVTRLHLAEEQLFRISRAVEQSPVSIIITDLDGRPQYVNAKFTETRGPTLEDVLDSNLDVLREGHASDASCEEMYQTVRAGGEWRGELTTRRAKGETLWESVKVSCLRNHAGEVTNLLCLREDITERKKLEHELRQAQKMESLGTLAGGIAHDFNNMLAIINGYAEFCLQGETPPAVLQKGLREIHRAAQRASGLVRQILTFSRKNEPRFAPVDLNQLVRDLVALLAETFPRNVAFNLELQDRLPALLADQNQLQQVILNLCVNARDAMPTGGTITLRTTLRPGTTVDGPGIDPTRLHACLQVTDTGTGMPPEVRARIFEPFFTTKQTNQGTGLGLAVVYGIVVGHKGVITVDSTPGVGSTFNVLLPLAADAVAPAIATGGPAEFPGGSESLLIVDDEASLRALLSSALNHKGYQTTTAATGLEAIEQVGDLTRSFDAVLLDLNMPGATGIEVMRVIRACRPETKVLVISGHITPDTRLQLKELGQTAIIQKPYTLDEVGRQLRRLIDAKSD
ncbi:MAG TPA: PAS domain S-box protein [Opitutaceae bacterium]